MGKLLISSYFFQFHSMQIISVVLKYIYKFGTGQKLKWHCDNCSLQQVRSSRWANAIWSLANEQCISHFPGLQQLRNINQTQSLSLSLQPGLAIVSWRKRGAQLNLGWHQFTWLITGQIRDEAWPRLNSARAQHKGWVKTIKLKEAERTCPMQLYNSFKQTTLAAWRNPILVTVCWTAVVALGILLTVVTLTFKMQKGCKKAWSSFNVQ